jgi:hypothetical protein
MSLSFTGFRTMGSGHLGTGIMIEITRWDMDIATEPGWDQIGRIDCGSLVFSRARVRADDFDWDLER